MDLAEYMIEMRWENRRDNFQEELEWTQKQPIKNIKGNDLSIEDYQKLIKDNDKLRDKLVQNLKDIRAMGLTMPNLAFESCNFNTFIREIEVSGQKFIYVATCNNNHWDLPSVIPEDKSKNTPNAFNSGDLYDGLWDEEFIEGEDYIAIDNKKTISINNHQDRFREMFSSNWSGKGETK